MGPEANVVIRDLTHDELPFLREMLYAALMWDGVSAPMDYAMAHPQVRIFHEDWGRPGDTALVAVAGEQLIGAAWYRYFTEAEHGEGFVDEATPEMAIAVVDGRRGQGVGRALLEALHDRAAAAGIPQLSLSVDQGNPAERLYAALGYVPYEPDDGLGRMVLSIGGPKP